MPNLIDVSDVELFRIAASGSEAAKDEIHNRFMRPLFRYCKCIVKDNYPDRPDLAYELSSFAYMRAINKAKTYKNDDTEAKSSPRTLSWLRTIALNLFRNFTKNPDGIGPLNPEVSTTTYYPDDYPGLHEINGRPPTFLEQTYIRDAFDSLDERSQNVLLRTLEFRELSKSKKDLPRECAEIKKYMPRGCAEILAKEFNTTKENIRKIRNKAIKIINNYVEEHMNTIR